MAVYDSEEAERIAALKDWWAKWGNLVLAITILFLLAIAGAQGWRYYQKQQIVEAEALFVSVQKVAQEALVSKDWKKLSSAATALADKYPSTFYATDAQLMAAKAAFDADALTEAKAHLQWVVDRGLATHQMVARVRLAAVLFDEKKYDDALKTLDAIKADTFTSLAADLKGDILINWPWIKRMHAARSKQYRKTNLMPSAEPPRKWRKPRPMREPRSDANIGR